MIWYLKKRDIVDYESTRVLEEAEKLGLDIQIVLPHTVDIIVTRSDRRSIRVNNEVVNLPSLVLPRTGSGTTYYTKSVLRHLERLHVPILNNSDSIEAAKDKMYTSQILAAHNIPIPRTMLVKFPVDISLVEKQIGFPCVIKVLSGSYGEGVHLVQNAEGFKELMEFINSLKSSINILIQEYISSKPGHDIRVMVIGGRPIGAMLRKSTDGSFKANITRGGVGEPFPLTDEISYIATETARILDLDIAGIDLLFDGEGFKVCEANSAPGFEGFEKFCNVNVAKEIVQYCSFRLKK
jgi:RimK family alpha-L-glutamate ligase